MNKTKKLVFALLATVLLLSSTLISLASAEDDLPKRTPLPDEPTDESKDIATSPPDEQLSTIQDNRTSTDENSTAETDPPGENLILYATDTATNNNNFAILGALSIILAVTISAIVVFQHRKHAAR